MADLVFFAGLFLMVGGLIKVGVIGSLSTLVTAATGDNVLLAAMLLLVFSGVLSGIVDSIPYVVTMAPLIADLAEDAANPGNVLWWALALGAYLGGNATIVGASVNVVVLGIAERTATRSASWSSSSTTAVGDLKGSQPQQPHERLLTGVLNGLESGCRRFLASVHNPAGSGCTRSRNV